jgi:hypothetical protein
MAIFVPRDVMAFRLQEPHHRAGAISCGLWTV